MEQIRSCMLTTIESDHTKYRRLASPSASTFAGTGKLAPFVVAEDLAIRRSRSFSACPLASWDSMYVASTWYYRWFVLSPDTSARRAFLSLLQCRIEDNNDENSKAVNNFVSPLRAFLGTSNSAALLAGSQLSQSVAAIAVNIPEAARTEPVGKDLDILLFVGGRLSKGFLPIRVFLELNPRNDRVMSMSSCDNYLRMRAWMTVTWTVTCALLVQMNTLTCRYK